MAQPLKAVAVDALDEKRGGYGIVSLSAATVLHDRS